MRTRHNKQTKYNLFAAIAAFAVGWIVVGAVSQEVSVWSEIPEWKVITWMYLGLHGVLLSNPQLGGAGFIEPAVAMGDLPMAPVLDSWTIPVITVSLATAYAAYRGRQRRGMLNNIYDSTRVGLFYLGCIVAAMVLTNVQPELSIFLVILLVIVLSMAVGSRLVGSVTGGLPFIGIASLGSIFLVGLLFVLGGLAVIGALIGPIIISVGTSAAVGTFIAVERHMANRGHGHDSMSTVYGLVSFLQEYQVETIIVVIIIAAATYFLFV